MLTKAIMGVSNSGHGGIPSQQMVDG